MILILIILDTLHVTANRHCSHWPSWWRLQRCTSSVWERISPQKDDPVKAAMGSFDSEPPSWATNENATVGGCRASLQSEQHRSRRRTLKEDWRCGGQRESLDERNIAGSTEEVSKEWEMNETETVSLLGDTEKASLGRRWVEAAQRIRRRDTWWWSNSSAERRFQPEGCSSSDAQQEVFREAICTTPHREAPAEMNCEHLPSPPHTAAHWSLLRPEIETFRYFEMDAHTYSAELHYYDKALTTMNSQLIIWEISWSNHTLTFSPSIAFSIVYDLRDVYHCGFILFFVPLVYLS